MDPKKVNPPQAGNTQELKRALQEHIQACIKLESAISTTGRPFNEKERELIRIAMLPMVTDRLNELKYFYLMGMEEDFRIAADGIHNLIEL